MEPATRVRAGSAGLALSHSNACARLGIIAGLPMDTGLRRIRRLPESAAEHRPGHHGRRLRNIRRASVTVVDAAGNRARNDRGRETDANCLRWNPMCENTPHRKVITDRRYFQCGDCRKCGVRSQARCPACASKPSINPETPVSSMPSWRMSRSSTAPGGST